MKDKKPRFMDYVRRGWFVMYERVDGVKKKLTQHSIDMKQKGLDMQKKGREMLEELKKKG